MAPRRSPASALLALLALPGLAGLAGCEDLPAAPPAAPPTAPPAAIAHAAEPAPTSRPADVVTAGVTYFPTSATAPTPAPGLRRPAGTIVPLYGEPDTAAWGAIIAGAERHPAVPVRVVVNPASGPGDAASPAYVTGLARLHGAGLVAIGYVATGWGERDLGAVADAITAWRDHYPDVDGLFFDEMAHEPGHEAYYREAAALAREAGMGVTVGNPGVDPGPAYDGIFDTVLVYERDGLPAVGGARFAGGDRLAFGMIPYDVPAYDEAWVRRAAADVGWLYVTSDRGANPWDTLSDHWEALLTTLEAVAAGR